MNNLQWWADSRYNSGRGKVLTIPHHTLIKVHVEGVTMTDIDSTSQPQTKQCSKCGTEYQIGKGCPLCRRERNRLYMLRYTTEKRNDPQYRERRRQIEREWRENNRERDRELKRRYEQTHHEEKLERGRIYRATHKEEIRERGRAYNEAHRDKKRAYSQQYLILHRDKVKAHTHRRRAMKKGAEGSHLRFDAPVQLKRQKGKCYYCQCKLDKYHIDHVIPLSRGGSDHPDNKVLSCPHCNQTKSAKLPHEFTKGGRLL